MFMADRNFSTEENRVKRGSSGHITPIFMKVGVKLIRKIQMSLGLTLRTGCRRPQMLRIPHIEIPIWNNCLFFHEISV